MTREQIIEAMARAGLMSEASAGVILRALETAIPGLADVIEGRAYVVHGGTLRDAVSCLRQNAQHAANIMDSPRAKWMNNSADHLTRAMIEAGKAGE